MAAIRRRAPAASRGTRCLTGAARRERISPRDARWIRHDAESRIKASDDVGEPIAGRARVVRETPDGLKGLAFDRLDADDRARLERYVGAGGE